jgi:hypothetical protein
LAGRTLSGSSGNTDLIAAGARSDGEGIERPLWFQYIALIYPASAKKAVVNHGLGKQKDARNQNGQ